MTKANVTGHERGWYRDPAGGLRYWDERWTQWVCTEDGRTEASALDTEGWKPPRGGVATDGAPWRVKSASHKRSVVSITISVATVIVFLDLFAPFTVWFGVGFALAALRTAAVERDRRLAWIALAVAIGTIVLFLLFMPMYNAMDEGM